MPPIESIDNLPKPLPNDRVNAAGKSTEEKDRESFKQALRRKLAGGDEADEAEEDALIVDIDLTRRQEDETAEDQKTERDDTENEAQDDGTAAGDTDASPAPAPHIDLKA